MKPTKSFLELQESLLQQGREEGRVQMQRQLIENFLLARFGAIDESLASSIEPLLTWSIAPWARLMLELSSLTRDEFLARCQTTQNFDGTH